MNLPDLERLATDWRKNTPPDRSPAYIADDLAAGALDLISRVRELEEALGEVLQGWDDERETEGYDKHERSVALRTKLLG